jgi:hypothetical protein
MAITPGDRSTLDLFVDWQPPKTTMGFEPAELAGDRLSSRISRAVGLALKRSGKSRAEIAEAMSARLGSPVSADMLDKYASESSESHKITLERFMALVEATGCLDLLGLVAEPFGCAVVPEKYAPLIELHFIEEHQFEIVRRKQELEARFRGRR